MVKVVSWPEMARVLPRIDLLPLIADGFAAYSRGDAQVTPVGELLFTRGEAHIKSGHIRGDNSFVVKVATGFYDNPARGLASSNGLLLVFDADTGLPRAILLDEGRLTDIRTAVAGAVAAKYLAPRHVEAIGIIGTGTQARLQAEHLAAVTDCRRVIVWGRNGERAHALGAALRESGYDVGIAPTPGHVVTRANLIVTTTPSHTPLLQAADIRPGTHITAVGADTSEKNELDPALLARADLVVADSLAQCRERGEIHRAVKRGVFDPDHAVELGAIIAGRAAARTSEGQITVADLTGVAVQDIKIAQVVLAALETETA